MLVAGELTLAGMPALKVPDNWPGYDVIAQPQGMPPQRISVKARTYRRRSGHFIDYFDECGEFDWLAIVLLPSADLAEPRIYVVSRTKFDAVAKVWHDNRTGRAQHYVALARVEAAFGRFRDNYLLRSGVEPTASPMARGGMP